MVRVLMLTFVISLTVGAFPALAEKQYKMSCYEFCAKKRCHYGVAARFDLNCNATCESKCIMMRADGTWKKKY
jgi:hypothetical protein